MKVKMLVNTNTYKGYLRRGQVVDVKQGVGQRWLKQGLAVKHEEGD